MKNKGASLAQYAIIIALVSIGVIGTYSMLGQQIVKQLNLYLNAYTANNVKIAENVKIVSQNSGSGLTTPGQWNGGAGNAPVSKCNGGSCDIDFGDYILTGVPEDFDSFVNSNSSSGGNEKIYSLYMQLANQLEASGDVAGAQDLKDLANLVNFMGSEQKWAETQASECMSVPKNIMSLDRKSCLMSKTNFGSFRNIPPELSSLQTNMYDANDEMMNQITNMTIGNSRNLQIADPSLFNSLIQVYPSAAFVNKYDEIIANPKYTSNLKNLVTSLYLTVDNINNTFHKKILTTAQLPNPSDPSANIMNIPIFDAITGSYSNEVDTLENDIELLINPNITANWDLTSSLKCSITNSPSSCNNW